jgi:putative aminopeptidase FrvX
MAETHPPEPDRAAHERWLMELTSIPTAAGREGRVIEWIEDWLDDRPGLALRRDGAGNLVIERVDSDETRPPLFVTGHLDHPAFVVEGLVGPSTVRLQFRGGVRDPYFLDAPVDIVTESGETVRARLIEAGEAKPFRACLAEVEGDASADDAGVAVGDVARWAMDPPSVDGAGMLHTHACDDLAAVTAALAMMDAVLELDAAAHVRLLLTRAEEVGFVGATWAMKHATAPEGSRLVLLENSRSFPDSPIGAGPILRVGDRLSTFSPALTAGLGKLAEDLSKQREGTDRPFRFQRKLMPGGACEATVYQAFGYEAACLCLPLGNYHNMADLDAVERGDDHAVAAARCDREFIALADFHWLVDLLVAAATGLGEVPSMVERLEKMFEERRVVLDP